MHYIWFWSFWHWSQENFRGGALLRGPLRGIGGHWDEWFRHESSERDRQSIENIGRSEAAQRQFLFWLCRHWAPEADASRNKLVPRFVLGQLAHVPPFDRWPAFARYRAGYGIGGIHAVVLADKSSGEPGDVRLVEALTLPLDADATASTMVAEGFRADATELEAARQAARSLLCGKALAALLARWVLSGRRPYRGWLSVTLFLGWVAVIGLILFLLFGPEPGERLFLFEAGVVALWVGLMLVAAAVVATVSCRAWRTGTVLRTRLEHSQVRLRMSGGLTIKGASAGLPFCLNILASLYRAHPEDARHSWLWQRFLRRLSSQAGSWAATAVIAEDGRLRQVVLEPKLRACLKYGRINQILTPRQREASKRTVDGLSHDLTRATGREAAAETVSPRMQLGFAAEKPRLLVHPCGHLAQSVMVLGDFAGRWQMGANAIALVVSAIMLAALPDLRSVLLPHLTPIVVLPASSSPYDLWVSLNTKYPEYFSVALESDYWSNRRTEVRPYGGLAPSVRAEIRFHRLIGMTAANEEDGVIWIERRRRFLGREFFPGERVGRYSISYLSRLGHE